MKPLALAAPANVFPLRLTLRFALVLALVLALSACKGRSSAPPPRRQLIDVIKSLADRACACNADRDCVQPLRDEFDAEKRDLLAHGLTGEDLAAFDGHLKRLRACGDAAGLTIWLQL